MKNRLLAVLVAVVLSCTLLMISGATSAPAHAASSANRCESDGQAVGLYTLSQMWICDVGNGNTQVTVGAYGGCMFVVSISVFYNGGQNGQGNVAGQLCTNEYTHTFPAQHRTGHVYAGATVTITEFGATETTYPTANIQD